jgi:hypothetical protein
MKYYKYGGKSPMELLEIPLIGNAKESELPTP